MKKNQKIDLWKTLFFSVIVLFFACTPGVGPGGDPTDPNDPTPESLVLPVVHIKMATNVTANAASIIAWVIPNENKTNVSFEYKKSTESTYHSKPLGSNYTGTDSIKVTFDFSDLVTNSEYSVRIKASNQAGDALDSTAFTTYIVKDYDGNIYHVVRVGTQLWLQENLKTTHYANGDAILTNGADYWAYLKPNPYYCYYDNNPENGKVYGALYNWFAATDTRGLIFGYHLPSISEFEVFQNYLGDKELAGNKIKESGKDHWDFNESTNSSGFTALGAGRLSTDTGDLGPFFMDLKSSSLFQCSDEFKAGQGYGFYLYRARLDESASVKTDACSIRLLKN